MKNWILFLTLFSLPAWATRGETYAELQLAATVERTISQSPIDGDLELQRELAESQTQMRIFDDAGNLLTLAQAKQAVHYAQNVTVEIVKRNGDIKRMEIARPSSEALKAIGAAAAARGGSATFK